jgi:hypothetical protein
MCVADRALGSVIFQCRRRSFLGFMLAIRDYGVAFLAPVISAGLLALPIVFCLQKALHVNFDWKHNPPTALVFLGLLVIGFALGVWWFWISPWKDYLIVQQHGFTWRVSRSKWDTFPIRGTALFRSLAGLRYRSDWSQKNAEASRANSTTAAKLARLLLDLSLSKRDLILQMKDGRELLLENLIARFYEEDLRRFLDHVSLQLSPPTATD